MIELAKSCKEEDGGMPDIIVIQEVRAETAERLQLERAWKALGYYPYSQEGLASTGRWEADRSNGRVMTCVKMEWDQKLLKKQRMGVAQQVVVEVGSWKVSNLYSPPGKREDINKMVVEMLVMDDGSPVLMGGDWNETVEEHLAQLLKRIAIEPTRFEEGASNTTRWLGSKRIDWIATNRPTRIKEVKMRCEKIADHKILQVEVPMRIIDGGKYEELSLGTKWEKPEDIQPKRWKELLEQAVGEIREAKGFDELNQLWETSPQEANVEAEWSAYVTELTKLYAEATRLAAREIELRTYTEMSQEAKADKMRTVEKLRSKIDKPKTKGQEVKWNKYKTKNEGGMSRLKVTAKQRSVGRLTDLLARISQKPWKESMTNQHVKNIMKKEAPEMLKRNWVEETEPKARKYIGDKIARIEREAEAEINLHRQKKLRE